MIGTILQDKYRVDGRIGKGGFATVYKGHDLLLNRPVAIKFLEDSSERKNFRERFLREAESMAGLSHANIVTVFDRADYRGRPYLVMELVDGPSLLELVHTTALSIPQVCAIGKQVCAAMTYAHNRGIIHRDLSLQNVMVEVDEEGRQLVKILDFGLAKLIYDEALSSSRNMMGTLNYMAPEQIASGEVDARVDIFAFGVGLYRMVNGRFPFEAEHPAAIMYLIMNEFNLEFAGEVPARMKDLIMGCLEKDPRNRKRDFDELLPELEAIQASGETADGTLSTTFSGLEGAGKRTSKRNPYLNRVMIKHPSEFFGRARDVRRIYSRLDAPHPQSISVVGERRIGKSSILNYVYHPRNRRSHMQNNENALFAYLDFQRDADYDVPRFIDFLFNMFSYETRNGHDYTTREKTLDQLKEVVQELHEEGMRIIILMDEFEAITRNENFEESFFSFLRSLANSYRVAYVTTSYEDLQRMCHNKDISDSPFFNIFSNLPLRPFTGDEARELIAVPSEAEGLPLAPYADEILELSGNFPLFLQIACSSVFEFLVDNPEREPDWEQITQSYMDEVRQHYRFVWERMEDAAQENLRRIASGKSINRKFAFVNEELKRRGYLVESNRGLNLCSASFREFVVEQAQRSRGQRGFFRRWGERG